MTPDTYHPLTWQELGAAAERLGIRRPVRPLCPICNAVIPTDEPPDNLHVCQCGKIWSNGEEYRA